MSFPGEVSERVALGPQRRRRSRVLYNVAVVAVTALLLSSLLVWQRNRVRLQTAHDQFEDTVADLVTYIETSGNLPLVYPPRDEDGNPTISTPDFTYIDPTTVRRVRGSTEPVIVAYSAQIRQIFGADKQVAAIKDGGRIRIEIMPAAKFSAMLAQQNARVARAMEDTRRGESRLP